MLADVLPDDDAARCACTTGVAWTASEAVSSLPRAVPAPTRRGALRLLGAGALAGLAAGGAVGVLFDAAGAEAQDGATRAALTARLADGRLALTPARVRGAPAGRVVGVIDADFRHALAALLDFAAYPVTFAPWLPRVRVLSRARGHARLYGEVALSRAAAPCWVELEARVEGEADGTHRVVLSRTRGELPGFEARWQLVATPGRVRTLASLTLSVAPPLPLTESALARVNLDAARSAFASLRRAAPRASRTPPHR